MQFILDLHDLVVFVRRVNFVNIGNSCRQSALLLIAFTAI